MEQRRFRLGARGQAALEYMMTYGWAILVLMIVGVALWQMNVFQPPAVEPGCNGFTQMIPIDTQLDSATDTLIIRLSNDAGTKLKLDEVEATIRTESGTDGTDVELRAGGKATATIVGFANPMSGDDYRATVVVTYLNTQSGITHKSTGECWGTAE